MIKDFTAFRKYFQEYRKLFGLTGYKIYFKYEPLDSFASIVINRKQMVATVRLNSQLEKEDKLFKDIKLSAKHEALHLLVGRLEGNARYRYSSENEIYEAVEELVVKLGELIK